MGDLFNRLNPFKKGKTARQAADDTDFTDKDAVERYILRQGLAEVLPFATQQREDGLYLPALQMTVYPEVQECRQNAVTLGFHMYSEKWEKPMYECCAGMAADARTAVGQALGSFAFGFMSGLKAAEEGVRPREITSEFAGHTHRWQVYLSDLVTVGSKKESEAAHPTEIYWELLKEDIIGRLGNQTFVYVKIYAAKLPDEVIGECRIDDVAIPELGDKIAKIAETWDCGDAERYFVSDKQFFFIEQSPETLLPYPYRGKAGREEMKSLVMTYLRLFLAAKSQQDYDRLVGKAVQQSGDRTLAMACDSFLPEICAAQAFAEKMTVCDDVEICLPDGTVIPARQSQLADFGLLRELIVEILNEKAFGDKTKDLYTRLVAFSSICDVMEQVEAQKRSLSQLRLKKLEFHVGNGFELR